MEPRENDAQEVSKNQETTAGRRIKRPLIPLVLALMLGLVAAAAGLHIPRTWLAAGLAILLVVMLPLYFSPFFRRFWSGKTHSSDESQKK
ncbi:MAG: hypothetical protein WAU47_07015 [Desulfobaccales bacterium]